MCQDESNLLKKDHMWKQRKMKGFILYLPSTGNTIHFPGGKASVWIVVVSEHQNNNKCPPASSFLLTFIAKMSCGMEYSFGKFMRAGYVPSQPLLYLWHICLLRKLAVRRIGETALTLCNCSLTAVNTFLATSTTRAALEKVKYTPARPSALSLWLLLLVFSHEFQEKPGPVVSTPFC